MEAGGKGPKKPGSRAADVALRGWLRQLPPRDTAQCSPLEDFTWILWLTLRFPRQKQGSMTCSELFWLHKLSYGGKDLVRCLNCLSHVWILMDFVYSVSCSDSNTTSSRRGLKSLKKLPFCWSRSFLRGWFVAWHHHDTGFGCERNHAHLKLIQRFRQFWRCLYILLSLQNEHWEASTILAV